MEKEKDIFNHLNPRKIQVPGPSYFEQLAKQVIMEEKKVIPFYKKPISWISAVAASVAVVLTTFLFSDNKPSSQDVLLALNECTAEEISEYIEANIDEFQEEEIAQYIPDSGFDITEDYLSVSTETSQEDKISFDEIDETDILEYLEDQELEPYELEDESFI